MSGAGGAKEKKKEEAPQQALLRLERALAAGELAPAYVFHGEERYFRERMSELVLRHAAQRGLETCRHDVKHQEFSLARLSDDLRGSALFSTARCVLLANVGPLVSAKSLDHSPAVAGLLLARIAQPDGGTLVLTAESMTSAQALSKAAQAAGGWVVQCRKLWDTMPSWGGSDPSRIELVGWLLERARALDVRLRPDEAQHVALAIGNDLSALESEIERLRERGGKTVAELVGWQAGASPWTVADDMVRGDVRATAEGLEALFRGGFQGRDGARTLDPSGLAQMLMNALYGKVREALAAVSILGSGASEKDAASFAGIPGSPRAQEGFRARMASRASREWSVMLEEVAALERRAHQSVPVDVNDFQLLALRWRNRARR